MSNPDWVSIDRWMPIQGRWDIGDVLAYTGTQPGTASPVGICVSDVELNEGAVRVHVKLSRNDPHPNESCGRILLGFRSPHARYISVGIGGYDAAFVVSEFSLQAGWRGIELSGPRENVTHGKEYELLAEVQGQRVTLKVDGVRVLETVLDQPMPLGQVGLFAWGPAPVEFRSPIVSKAPGSAFVVMEFKEPYQQLYKQVIQPTARRYGLEAYHGGEVYESGIVLQDIVTRIINAQVVIAEITPPNQNVFYELGYAHALGKPTILLADRSKQLPFDVSGYRCIYYDNTIAGKADVEVALSNHLKAIFGSSHNGSGSDKA